MRQVLPQQALANRESVGVSVLDSGELSVGVVSDENALESDQKRLEIVKPAPGTKPSHSAFSLSSWLMRVIRSIVQSFVLPVLYIL